MNWLIRLSVQSVGLKVIRFVLGIGTSILLTHLMTQHDYGVYAYVLVVATLLAIPGEAGIPNLMMREITRARVDEDAPRIRGLMIFSNLTVIGLTLIMAAGTALFLWNARGRVAPEFMIGLATVFPAILLGSLANTRAGIQRALGDPILSQLPEQVVRPIGIGIFAIVVFAMFDGPLTTLQGLAGYVLASASAFLLGNVLLRRTYKRTVGSGRASFQTGFWFKALLPFSAIAGLQVALTQSSAFVLGIHAPPTEMALFRVATLGSDFALFSLFAIGTITGPKFAEHHHRDDQAAMQELIGQSNLLNLLFAGSVLLGILLLGPLALRIGFGPQYAASWAPMAIIAAGHFVSVTMSNVTSLANMSGRERLTIVSAAFGFGLNIALSLVLCPIYGAVGAAIATAISAVSWRVLVSILLYRASGLRAWDLDLRSGPSVWLFMKRLGRISNGEESQAHPGNNHAPKQGGADVQRKEKRDRMRQDSQEPPGGRVAVMTRLVNDNAGNEALSTVLARYLVQHVGSDNVRLMDRHPQILTRFRFDRLARAEDPIAEFERIVDKVQAWGSAAAPLSPTADEAMIGLIATPRIRSPLMRWAKRTIRIRSRLKAFGLLQREDADAMLNTLYWADMVVWNPAGELHPKGRSDEVMLLLVMVRLAQRLGKRIAIVNHSLEATDPVINRLITLVYRDADFISVREQGSYDRGIELQVPAGKLHIVPDLAFMLSKPGFAPELELPPADPLPEGSIVLSINGLEAHRGGDESWRRLITGLKMTGRPIVFVSNSMKDDIPFARKMEREAQLDFHIRQPGYAEMVRLYRGAALVISSRLHASIFAMCAGAPVISIEPQLFKLTGIFAQLRYPFATHQMGDPGWAAKLLADAQRALDERAVIVEAGDEGLRRQVAAIEASYAAMIALVRA
ncbi:polysaccharide pyruvyl transferase family protein [Sphingomonas sp. LB-2]|uniref:polysaccharide pyruvyl transferase family protein n=1 Tax=Sphingomonas caeni TaxID=2984949 RepID=UPI002230C402|nr:polysaccharide pyruvyl transferase family protein [Sphingomonas caeni]MCW3848497.1 polysaccharide pyruvyl transferase family protein [Sphingomonas caeni]